VRTAADPPGASESAVVNTVMVCIKLGVLGLFAVIAFTAFDADHFANFAPFGVAAIGAAAGRSSSLLHRLGRGIHRGRRSEGPAEKTCRGPSLRPC